ncbi:MAG: class I SAM-dependent methyltransferase [Phycisphaerae bacterium]|nr:class I SAM-dependent methyltransferase [Phycisphaerae bacterium]
MSTTSVRADLVWENAWGFARTAVLAAAVELDLFAAFADGPADAAALAARVKASARGIDALAGALVGMGLLSRDALGQFDVTELARTYLGPSPRINLAPQILHTKNLAVRWWKLAEAVRTGQPLAGEPGAPRVSFEVLVRQLFNGNFAAGMILCRSLAERDKFQPAAVLDVGAGAAPWSIPFAQANPACRVTVIDYPQVLPVTREYAARFSVADRFSYRGEPAETADLGREQFDFIFAGHLYHSMGPEASADLARRAAAALKPGGLLGVAEFVVNDDRTGPAIPLLFACNMLLGTAAGTTYTGRQIDDWARAAGLLPIAPIEIPTGPAIRLARKP